MTYYVTVLCSLFLITPAGPRPVSLSSNAMAPIMTKDQMRALLADLVPSAIADGRAYVVRRASGSAVSVLPNDEAAPHIRAPRPRRIYQRQGVYGAGFDIPTYKTFQGVGKDDVTPIYPVHHRTYFCHICGCSGKECVC